ncbi:MAG: hypothetical protein IJ190_02795 [Prevotella sp.]|nr:hypothetical protein [Prevotella sp.]
MNKTIMEQKKIYEQPTADVVEMKFENALLAGSGDGHDMGTPARQYDFED